MWFCGPDVLKRGGNAADAAVAIAAALSVTEPCSTGPGGDAFCLFYDGHTGDVSCINGRLKTQILSDAQTNVNKIEHMVARPPA